MQAFVRYLSCFLIIQACVCGGVLVLYKRYAAFTLNKTGYLAASVDKHHLLVQQPSPRIVFVGGSNFAFGLDSLAIERSLGYHPINMGLHLALGLDFMLAEIEAFLKPDDVVLISLEYEHFVDLYTEDGGTLFTEIQSDPHSIHFLTFRHLALFCDQGLIIIGSMTRRDINWLTGWLTGEAPTKALPELKTAYRRSSFNQFGDAIAHHDFVPKPFSIYQYRPPTRASIDRIIHRLNAFHDHCQRQGILTFYSYPPLVQGQMQANADTIHKIAFNLSQRLNFPLLDTPEEMSYPLDDFFDHPYHLTAAGTHSRTDHLIEKLRGKLVRVLSTSPHM